MFARILNASSTDCLQPDDPLTPSQQLREESRRTRSMVTTRGRARELADTPSVNGDSTFIDEGTPVPKRRGRPRKSLPVEDDEIVETPRPTRSSSKLMVQASDEEGTPKQQSPQVIDEIPASDEEVEEANEPEKAQAIEEVEETNEPEKAQAIEEVEETNEPDKAQAIEEVEETNELEKAQAIEEVEETNEPDKAQAIEEVEETNELEKAQAIEEVEETNELEKAQAIEEVEEANELEKAQAIEADEEVVKTTAVNGDVTTSSTTTTTTVTTPVVKKHKRFDSAEPETVPEEKPEVIDVEDREDESSDDDAPEEVTTNQAAESAKEKEREAAKAIEEQEAASKKKRQEKDALLKRQSEASSKKRKLDLTSAQDEMLPPAQKSKVDESLLPGTTERGDIEMDEESNTLEGDGTADGRLDSEDDIEEINRTFAPPGHLPLPDLLPAEYLEDDDDKPEPTHLQSNLPTRFAKPNKLRHILEKRPKDKRVGSTTFRVAESRNSHLPPKASNQARALKESWLQGRAGSKIKPNRKPFNQGFLKPKN